MKKRAFTHRWTCVIVATLMITITACSSSKTTSSTTNFIAPGYQKKDYKKILVLTLVEQPIYQKRIEDAVVKEFKERGYPFQPAHINFPGDIRKDTANLRTRIENEGYDAALVLTYLGEMSGIQEQAHYNGNMYSVFYGSYPVYDVDTKSIKTAVFQCDFYVNDKKGTQWRAPVSVRRNNDAIITLQLLSRSIRQQIMGDKIL